MNWEIKTTESIPGEALPQTRIVELNHNKKITFDGDIVPSSIDSYKRPTVKQFIGGFVLPATIVLGSYAWATELISGKEASSADLIQEENSEDCEKADFQQRFYETNENILIVSEAEIESVLSTEFLSTHEEYLAVISSIENVDDDTALVYAKNYLGFKNIQLELGQGENKNGFIENLDVKPSKKQLQNLIMSLNTIPKNILDASNLRKIIISNEIARMKSNEQIEYEKSSNTYTDELGYSGGYYSLQDGLMGIVTDYLTDPHVAIKVLWHEVVGHGAASAVCDIYADSEFHRLGYNFLGEEIPYAPEWKQTKIQDVLFSLGIVVKDSYGGSNMNEDLATITEEMLFQNIFLEDDSSVVDEKTRLISQRLLALSPGLVDTIRVFQAGLHRNASLGTQEAKYYHPLYFADLLQPPNF